MDEILKLNQGDIIYVKEKIEDQWQKREFVKMDETNTLYGCINIWNKNITYWELAKKI